MSQPTIRVLCVLCDSVINKGAPNAPPVFVLCAPCSGHDPKVNLFKDIFKGGAMSKENIYETEIGDDDTLYQFVYEIEPYSPGGRDEPPSGGYAEVYEIRHADGSKLPEDSWVAAGITPEALEKIEEEIYEWHGEEERDRYESAMEDKADAKREERD